MAKLPPDAFAFYLALGPARSYQAVAEQYGVAKQTVGKRALREQWQERVDRIESQARERAEAQALETLEEMNLRHLKTLKVVQAKALEALRQYPLQSAMDACRALDRAIRAERLIRGEPTDRDEHGIAEIVRRESERWLIRVDEDEGDLDGQP